jgi:very-short-patch-repair endonuclease
MVDFLILLVMVGFFAGVAWKLYRVTTPLPTQQSLSPVSLPSVAVNYKEAARDFTYTRKRFLLTRAEHTCFEALVTAVGDEYYIFAQVHLPTLLDHKVYGQDWRAARAHIDRKSVDFVLCDKDYLSPQLAIELDDWSHELPERQERDQIVERIFSEAGLPLLRLQSSNIQDSEHLRKAIFAAVKRQTTEPLTDSIV